MHRRPGLLLVFLLVACASTAALASSTRLIALGGDGAYLEDAVNARVWYGSLVDHGGWVAAESGAFEQHDGYARDWWDNTASGPALGAQAPIGQDGRHGTAGLWWNSHGANGGSGELGSDQLGDTWQVMYGRRFGTMTAGLSLRHGAADADLTESLHHNATRDDFGLGLRMDLGPTAYLDLAGELVRLADESTLGAVAPEPRSTAGSYGWRARAFVQIGDGLVLVPMLENRREERDWDELAQPADRSWRLWRAGAGLTWQADPDHLLLLAADWRDERDTGNGVELFTADVLDVRLAIESRIHALLTMRLAAGYRRTDMELAASSTGTKDEVPLSLGLAAHLGPADLEFSLSNLPPVGPDGLLERWRWADDSTWMSAGLSYWF